jgi:lipid-A-disaccharide synthase
MSDRGSTAPVRIALAAGEQSGDLLGASLIAALRERLPNAQFEGIAGPRMIRAGCTSLYPMERLSVMGLVEVAGRYISLMRDRRVLAKAWLRDPPDIFIGIDAPDFNLGLAKKLRTGGVRTVHYVSPSVWAWRRYRIKGIRASVDRMLTLFPFEAEFYRTSAVEVRHVGHPLADDIPLVTDRAECRRELGLDPDATLVALLPGSRMSEIDALADLMFDTARWLTERLPTVKFVLPAATPPIRAALEERIASNVDLTVTLVDGDARRAMGAADVVLLASGTATLEALLVNRPMVVTYRVHPLTFRIMKAMFTVKHVSLPNLLAGEELVPELLQTDAQPDKLGAAILDWLRDEPRKIAVQERFGQIHQELRGGAAGRAADAVMEVLP